jgi:TetR/AcrR family transcriptional regulator
MAETTGSKSSEKVRDAERSREAILAAAERLFAARGFDGASLNDIAVAAKLSRGTPSYFFGSKERLYGAVLERVFAEREEATRDAFRPLVEWSESESGGSLEKALAEAAAGYMDFLLRRPSFLQLLQREELAGARRLREAPRDSHAIEDAFQALRAVAPKRGLGAFDVADAVLLFVSLTFSPLTQRSTFMASLGRDLDDPKVRRRHVKLVAAQLGHFVEG